MGKVIRVLFVKQKKRSNIICITKYQNGIIFYQRNTIYTEHSGGMKSQVIVWDSYIRKNVKVVRVVS